jgi:hypothetical protein
MLFDIVRELNEEIHMMVNAGKPARMVPRVFGCTDGTVVEITFMDMVLWNSNEWTHQTGDEDAALEAVKNHIRARITDHLNTLYNIQF